jgi:hypothetical protein
MAGRSGQGSAVGIGGIGRGEENELGFFGGRIGAQLAQQIDGGRQRELGCAQAGDEVAAADAAAFFKGLEHAIDGAESAGDVFRGNVFAEENAVAVEKLEGEGVGGFGLGGTLRGSSPFIFCCIDVRAEARTLQNFI